MKAPKTPQRARPLPRMRVKVDRVPRPTVGSERVLAAVPTRDDPFDGWASADIARHAQVSHATARHWLIALWADAKVLRVWCGGFYRYCRTGATS